MSLIDRQYEILRFAGGAGVSRVDGRFLCLLVVVLNSGYCDPETGCNLGSVPFRNVVSRLRALQNARHPRWQRTNYELEVLIDSMLKQLKRQVGEEEERRQWWSTVAGEINWLVSDQKKKLEAAEKRRAGRRSR